MKVSIINFKDKPLFVASVREVESTSFLALKKEAEDNLKELLEAHKQLQMLVGDLETEIEDLKREIKLLKGEE